ncbi:MAG: MBL fold metallo-hydrolase [Planctomycetota bacterium]|jgi:ribonuclease J|nr:MBL fold metallo-hydrolase [Planctomycetota bacterium]
MPAPLMNEPVKLCIHRAADTIGGNCVELAFGDQRLLLDAGMPLDEEAAKSPLPSTLDTSRPVQGVLLSHLHGDHTGAVPYLPAGWNIYCGEPTAMTLDLLSRFGGHDLRGRLRCWENGRELALGASRIIPRLVDHSAYDAYMLEIAVAGKRILYSGDFRMHGRKSKLMQLLLRQPPADVDILILEGTNLFRPEQTPKPVLSEDELEAGLADLFAKTRGRVFASWSATNLDRTVTMFRACKRTGRTLVLDAFTMKLLDSLRQFYPGLPGYDWEGCFPMTVITSDMARVLQNLYGDTRFIDVLKNGKAAISAAALSRTPERWVIMTRDSLVKDYRLKGVVPSADDAWIWSQWRGYLERENTRSTREFLKPCGEPIHLHTSGHASPDDLVEFVRAIHPGRIIPVHGEGWEYWAERFPNCLPVANGEWVEL